MRLARSALVAITISLMFAGSVAAQNAPGMPRSGHIKTEMVPSLFVMNSRGATLEGKVLTLTGVAPTAIVFADRPVRAAGHVSTQHLLEEWASGSDSFAKNPPNATVSVLSKDAASAVDAVVVLKNPRLNGDNLAFDVNVLEGDLAGADGPAAVFIDIIGMPLTPYSYAGAARRAARRAYWYGPRYRRPYPYRPYPPMHPYYPYPPPRPYYHPYY